MKISLLLPLLLCYYFVTSGQLASSATIHSRYESIFNFGDSLSDTGNLLRSGALAFPVIGKLPYGETFFRHATGRCSDGRLIIDFIAEAFRLPHLTPYLKIAAHGLPSPRDVRGGVNFAVSGATALDPDFFYARKIGKILWTNDSLSTQLGWFKKLKPLLCSSKPECDAYFKKSLFLVGEIGGNDYNYPFFIGASMEDLRAVVPLIVGAIVGAATTLIEEGAVELMVPGNLPIGCSAVYLTLFQSPNSFKYDPRDGCLKAYNDFAKYHNEYLKKALQILQQKYPHTRIIYADYYGAAMRIFGAPGHYGFSKGALRACCGGGGPYNFNNSARCGHVGSTSCNNPSAYANWDGIHLTDAAYGHIARQLINEALIPKGSLSAAPGKGRKKSSGAARKKRRESNSNSNSNSNRCHLPWADSNRTAVDGGDSMTMNLLVSDQYLSEILLEEISTQRDGRRGRVTVWRPHLESISETP